MTTVTQIITACEALAPLHLAMDWDNSGFQLGDKAAPVTKVLIALDPFEDVCQEALSWGAELILTHHPLFFNPIKSITSESSIGRAAMLLLENHISLWSGHTCLDVAEGGVNDVLAQRLGLTDAAPLPPENLLRVGTVPEMPLDAFLQRVKEKLNCPNLRYSSAVASCKKIAVGGGACGSELFLAQAAGCDTFVTSDIKYNQFWDARDLGMNLIDAGHFYTENPVCQVLAEKIRREFPEVEVRISKNHADCMKFF